MTNNTYEYLSGLWKHQGERFDEWRIALVREAHALRNLVASKIGGPERWESHDRREQRRYVEVIDLSVAEKPVAAAFSKNAITDDGELYFGLSFTFDRGVNAYPKTLYHIAIAVRFNNNQPQFSFWDTQLKCSEPQGSWLSDKEALTEQIVERLTRYLSFDPFSGVERLSSIGFVQT